MVDGLEVPEALAGACVEGEGAVAEEAGAGAVAAPFVVGGRAGAHEDDAALVVEGEAVPDVGGADFLPGVGRPGVVAELGGVGDGVEDPSALAGADVEGADVAGGGGLGAFAGGGAEDEEVFEDHRWGVVTDVEVEDVGVEAVFVGDAAVFAESGDGDAGFGVEGVEVVAGGVEDAVVVFAVGPVGEAAVDAAGAGAVVLGVEAPDEFSGFGVEGGGVDGVGGEVDEAVDDDGVALDGVAGVAGFPGPGDFEVADVGAVDLVEGGVVGAGVVAVVGLPLGVGGFGVLGVESYEGCQEEEEVMWGHGGMYTWGSGLIGGISVMGVRAGLWGLGLLGF